MSNHSLQFWRLWVKIWSQRDTSNSQTAKDIDSCGVDSAKEIYSHVSETAKDICKANNYQPNCHKSLCSQTASRAPAIKCCLTFHLRKWWKACEWEIWIKIKGDLLVAKLCGANAPEITRDTKADIQSLWLTWSPPLSSRNKLRTSLPQYTFVYQYVSVYIFV